MNPWGILFISMGLIILIIGFKGSQHRVVDAFKGTKAKSATASGATDVRDV